MIATMALIIVMPINSPVPMCCTIRAVKVGIGTWRPRCGHSWPWSQSWLQHTSEGVSHAPLQRKGMILAIGVFPSQSLVESLTAMAKALKAATNAHDEAPLIHAMIGIAHAMHHAQRT